MLGTEAKPIILSILHPYFQVAAGAWRLALLIIFYLIIGIILTVVLLIYLIKLKKKSL